MRPISAKQLKVVGRMPKNPYEPFNQMSLLKTQNQGYQKNFQSYSALPTLQDKQLRSSAGFDASKSQFAQSTKNASQMRPQSAKSQAHLKNQLSHRPMSASANRKPQQQRPGFNTISQMGQSIDGKSTIHQRPQSGRKAQVKK